jgi:glycerol-3-phosphate dehydrogenase
MKLAILNHRKCLELEPNVNVRVRAGLLCTSSYIVDPVCLTNRLVESAIVNGVKLFLGAKVESITKLADDFIVRTVNYISHPEGYRAKFVVNAAGHYADFTLK